MLMSKFIHNILVNYQKKKKHYNIHIFIFSDSEIINIDSNDDMDYFFLTSTTNANNGMFD